MVDRFPHRQSGRPRLRIVASVLGLALLAAVGFGARTSAQEDAKHPSPDRDERGRGGGGAPPPRARKRRPAARNTTPTGTTPGRYQPPDDTLLAYLQSL